MWGASGLPSSGLTVEHSEVRDGTTSFVSTSLLLPLPFLLLLQPTAHWLLPAQLPLKRQVPQQAPSLLLLLLLPQTPQRPPLR